MALTVALSQCWRVLSAPGPPLRKIPFVSAQEELGAQGVAGLASGWTTVQFSEASGPQEGDLLAKVFSM